VGESVFVAVHSLHRSHNRNAGEYSVKLSVSGDVCGVVDVDFVGIDSQGFVEFEDGDAVVSQGLRVVDLRQSVHISQKKKKFCFFFSFC
jgi:hypothetical protein